MTTHKWFESNTAVELDDSYNKCLVANRLKCPDGTILHSKNIHDFVSHTQADGRTYSLDGGNAYTRISAPDSEYELCPVYFEDGHEEVREVLYWGSRGVNGDQPLVYNPVKDLTDDHLKALVPYLEKYAGSYAPWIVKVIKNEIEWRNK